MRRIHHLRGVSSAEDIGAMIPSNNPQLPVPYLSKQPKTLSRFSSVANLLREDSEWSPPPDRKLCKDMPCLPRRYLHWSRSVKPADPDETTVWIFDNTAFRLDDVPDAASKFPHQKSSHAFVDLAQTSKLLPPPPARWQVEYVVAYFAEKLIHDPNMVAKAVCAKLKLSQTDLVMHAIQERLEPFITPVLPRATLRIKIDHVETQTLGPASSFGISSSVNTFHFEPPSGHHVTTSAAALTGPSNFVLPCTTVLAEPHGWGVISDLDDTIKMTGTPSPIAVLKSTFIDDPEPVRGMPELYSRMHELLSNPIWFYVSASPYNLYPFLRKFRDMYYPRGTIILRDASWQNLAGLMSSLCVDVQEYKINRMMKIHGWFPKRAFVCVGDSTQKDPEMYAEMARRFPGWIKAIFIRRVSDDDDVMGDRNRNSDARFEKAFEGLRISSGCSWVVFDEPDEVNGKINEILTTEFLPERVVEL